MSAATKLLSVLRIYPAGKTKIAINPFSVRRGTASKYAGLPCDRCVIITRRELRERGLDIVRDLFLRAPVAVDEVFDGYSTKPAEPFAMKHHPVKLFTYVTRGTVGRIEARPATRLYFTGQIRRFGARVTTADLAQAIEELLP